MIRIAAALLALLASSAGAAEIDAAQINRTQVRYLTITTDRLNNLDDITTFHTLSRSLSCCQFDQIKFDCIHRISETGPVVEG